jgi:hypothetical protein
LPASLHIRAGLCVGEMPSEVGLFLLELFFWTSKRKVIKYQDKRTSKKTPLSF